VTAPRRRKPTAADHAEASAEQPRIRPCPRCGADILTARTPDRVAAIDVRAEPQPIDPALEEAARAAGRHTWCLTGGGHTPQRIRWRDRWHAPHCTHPVLIDHLCRPAPGRPVQGVLL
jgi:hypothetical protein